jgi:hypothetical protein
MYGEPVRWLWALAMLTTLLVPGWLLVGGITVQGESPGSVPVFSEAGQVSAAEAAI